ncbi:head GIN domain-containing protein [Flavihumibacter sp. CACIAM 22H1]|uniref:head GIN domain-containing protein n=1 Tax=Flavihumibacter sp. CACIAM 22H1 TaxID=1812911 RepID=UPI0007A80BED|nr:head GIN domain-containing protein [Flavihumibacter sp. CACIAM 22H1]KYP14671.1 MAG: hypothetical protein A1D16_09720 [Flavihumibacter sp. CACIAM 22H1]
MHKIFSLLLLLCISTGLLAQTTTISDNNARTRSVGSFTGVKVSAGIELLLQQGDKEAVAVSCTNPEYTDRIKTVVEGGVLKITIDQNDGNWKWRKGLKFKAYVSIRELTELSASSGATAKTGSTVKAAKVKLDASSGAIMELSLNAAEIDSDNSSGAITEVSGNVEKLTVEASSGAVFKGYGLSSTFCSADVSSGGVIDITVTKELNAEASSGGAIHYKGGGLIRNLRTGSGGSVKSQSK